MTLSRENATFCFCRVFSTLFSPHSRILQNFSKSSCAQLFINHNRCWSTCKIVSSRLATYLVGIIYTICYVYSVCWKLNTSYVSPHITGLSQPRWNSLIIVFDSKLPYKYPIEYQTNVCAFLVDDVSFPLLDAAVILVDLVFF